MLFSPEQAATFVAGMVAAVLGVLVSYISLQDAMFLCVVLTVGALTWRSQGRKVLREDNADLRSRNETLESANRELEQRNAELRARVVDEQLVTAIANHMDAVSTSLREHTRLLQEIVHVVTSRPQ